VQSNPNRDLKGHLLYVLPEGAGADSAALAQKLLAELETKRFRNLMPKLFDGLVGERSPSDRGSKSSGGDGGEEQTKPSKRSKGGDDSGRGSTSLTGDKRKRDLYS